MVLCHNLYTFLTGVLSDVNFGVIMDRNLAKIRRGSLKAIPYRLSLIHI